MRFVIDGNPVAKARPRFSRRGGFVTTYDSQQAQKNKVKAELKHQFLQALNSKNNEIAIDALNLASDGVFMVKLWFYMKVPESATEGERNAKLWGLNECTTKPDLDNLEKFILDCCVGVIFPDDCQIVFLQSIKKFANKPRVVIDIMKRKPMSINEKAQGILRIFGPDRLMGLVNDMWDLFELYDVEEGNDWVEDAVGEEDARAVRLAKTAYVLSMVSANHSRAFSKIQKKYPDFWKDAERIEREVTAAKNGEQNNVLEEKKQASKCPVFEKAY